MIIDYTYFIGKLSLPQIENTEGRNLVNQFIDKFETEYLKKALGYDLWKAFTDGIAGSGTPDQRWIDLLEGGTYTHCGKTMEWVGFQHDDTFISPIANYVYYQYIENDALNTALIGTVVSKTDNNRNVNPVPKLVDAWNRMVEMNRGLAGFLNANKETYPEWVNLNLPVKWFWDYWYNYEYYQNDVYERINSLDL